MIQIRVIICCGVCSVKFVQVVLAHLMSVLLSVVLIVMIMIIVTSARTIHPPTQIKLIWYKMGMNILLILILVHRKHEVVSEIIVDVDHRDVGQL